MDVIVSGKNMEVTPALKDYVTKKVGKMAKFLDHQAVTARAVLSVEKDRQIVEVTVPVEGRLLRGEEATGDMYASVDLVVDKLDRQFRKYKTRAARRPGAGTRGEEPESAASGVVRRKQFPVKPMSLDEALLQMDLLGHDFFAFSNSESGHINVLYRRHDGDYGLLEPQ